MFFDGCVFNHGLHGSHGLHGVLRGDVFYVQTFEKRSASYWLEHLSKVPAGN